MPETIFNPSTQLVSALGFAFRRNSALTKPLKAVPLTPFDCLFQNFYLGLSFTLSEMYRFFHATIRGLLQVAQRRQKSFPESKVMVRCRTVCRGVSTPPQVLLDPCHHVLQLDICHTTVLLTCSITDHSGATIQLRVSGLKGFHASAGCYILRAMPDAMFDDFDRNWEKKCTTAHQRLRRINASARPSVYSAPNIWWAGEL